MSKNVASQSLLILVLTIVILFGLSFLPEFDLLSVKVKKINLLQDVIAEKMDSIAVVDSVVVSKDTVKAIEKKAPLAVRKKGSLEVEDFGPDHLNPFFESLAETKTKPVRIAFFGDSFIEGDILVAHFRDTLQTLFGGRGVGYMPITSEVNMFRTSIWHNYANWETFSLNGKKNELHPLGFAGYCFLPKEGNEVEYKPGFDKRKLPSTKILYKTPTDAAVSVYIDDNEEARNYVLPGSDTLREFLIPGKNYEHIKFSFDSIQYLKLYGAAIEDSIGISVDNFSMRSNPGLSLNMIPDAMFKEFNQLRDYKLIILQYGLNVVHENDSIGYRWYEEKMTTLVQRLKTLMPNASFLLLSVSDRCSKQGNEMKTVPGIFALRDAQRRVAYRCGIGFWDLFEGMGGENSMVKFTEAVPPLGAKDYTHLTFKGGRKIAKRFADALLRQKKRV